MPVSSCPTVGGDGSGTADETLVPLTQLVQAPTAQIVDATAEPGEQSGQASRVEDARTQPVVPTRCKVMDAIVHNQEDHLRYPFAMMKNPQADKKVLQSSSVCFLAKNIIIWPEQLHGHTKELKTQWFLPRGTNRTSWTALVSPIE